MESTSACGPKRQNCSDEIPKPWSCASSEERDPQRPLVQLEGVGIAFGRQPVLRDIDLAIPQGQTLAIIGESGCGKTVLLKTIIGLLHPVHGTVHFDGRDLAKLSERELTRQRIRFGFLFQQAALFDSMTIAQNVAFPLRQHTRKTAEEIRRAIVPPGWPRWACRRTFWIRSRPNFRAACENGWGWPGRWP